ncbi:non-ribosomal peptide synthetase [Legionella sp. CNM-4043-24]|uniref:non-ribosomal peptide synthetase n=1 Tax=Legionella sp. CNM-4043-24 TaxID=3421646 RepID=UPI00403B20D3
MFEIFNQAVQSTPDNLAFILSNGEELSYTEAAKIVKTWAAFLYANDVRQGDLVALLSDQEDVYVFVHLALDYLNASIVPFDSNAPSGQLKAIQGFQHFLLDDSCQIPPEDLPQTHNIVMKRTGVYPPEHSSVLVPEVTRSPDIPNYLVASSGVTNINKKWIPIGSAGLHYWADALRRQLPLNFEDRILCTRSPAYDARIYDYIQAFACGATLVLMSSINRRSLSAIAEQCERQKITCMTMISSQLSVSYQKIILKRMADAGLKHLMVTGDTCTPMLKNLCETFDINLWNGYGPTEATFGMSLLCVNGLSLIEKDGKMIVPIGKPWGAEVKYHLIESCLYIESPYLSPGYRNDPVRAARNFPLIMTQDGRQVRAFNTENKFSEQGDYLVLEGRIDDNAHVKIVGEKIKAEEVKDALESYNRGFDQDVIQVYVVVKQKNDKDRLVAYVAVNQADFDKQAFKKYIKDNLIPAAVPNFIQLDSLPRLVASQKIDQQQLRQRVDEAHEYFFHIAQTSIAATSTDSGYAVDKIWCNILGLDHADPEQEFMFCGGDSFQLSNLYLEIKLGINPDYRFEDLVRLSPKTLENVRKSITSTVAIDYSAAEIAPISKVETHRDNFFFLPPLLGEGYFTYKKFAGIFTRTYNCNVYGLSDPGRLSPEYLPNSLEDAADRYINAIKTVQPKGPYQLLGYSFGATLAYYVAQRLTEAGDTVNIVHLVDGYPPTVYQKLPPAEHAVLLRALIAVIHKGLNSKTFNENITETCELEELINLDHCEQIDVCFDRLEAQLTNPGSVGLVAIARRHLTLAMQTTFRFDFSSQRSYILSVPPKLPVNAFFYLSKADQPYLQAIERIPTLAKHSIAKQYFYWNDWFDQVVLGTDNRVELEHLELLTAEPAEDKPSADMFFLSQRVRPYAYWRPEAEIRPFYTKDAGSSLLYEWLKLPNTSIIHYDIFALSAQSLQTLQSTLLRMFPEARTDISSLYEMHTDMLEREKLCTARYKLHVGIPAERASELEDVLDQFHIERRVIHGASRELEGKISDSVSYVLKTPPFFYINLNLPRQDGSNIVTLAFKCRGDLRLLLLKIFLKTGLELDVPLSEPAKASYFLTLRRPQKPAGFVPQWFTVLDKAPNNNPALLEDNIDYYMPLLHNLIHFIAPFIQGLPDNRFDGLRPFPPLKLPFKINLSMPNKSPRFFRVVRAAVVNEYSPLTAAYPNSEDRLDSLQGNRLAFSNELSRLSDAQWRDLNQLAQSIHQGISVSMTGAQDLINQMERLVAYAGHLQHIKTSNQDPGMLRQTQLFWLEAAYRLAQQLIPDLERLVAADDALAMASFTSIAPGIALLLNDLSKARRYKPLSTAAEILPLQRTAFALAVYLSEGYPYVQSDCFKHNADIFEAMMFRILRQCGKQDCARFEQAEQILLVFLSEEIRRNNQQGIGQILSELSNINREKFEYHGHQHALANALLQAKSAISLLENTACPAYADAMISLIKALDSSGETDMAQSYGQVLSDKYQRNPGAGLSEEQLEQIRPLLYSSSCTIL